MTCDKTSVQAGGRSTVRPRVLVFNHFAAPRGLPGGTRHAELFGRLETWSAVILSADRNYATQKRSAPDPSGLFRFVPVTPLRGSGISRVLSWASYSATSFLVGLCMQSPDLVFGSSPHLLAAEAGLALARVRRVPFILEVRDLWPRVLVDMHQMSANSSVFRLLRRIEQHLYRESDAIVVMAKGVNRVLVEEGVSPQKIHYIPNGADPADFESSVGRDDLRQRYDFSGFVVAYTGAHGVANGLNEVLRAAEDLIDDPEIQFLLVGNGSEKPSLIRQAESRGLTNVRFMDPVSKEEMADLLRAVDVGLHCLADVPLFKYGVSPNKLFDYMAAGLPVITNTGGEVAALVESVEAGLAVEVKDIAGAVRQLRQSSPDQLAKWGSNGRAHMEKNQSRIALGEALVNLLDSVHQAKSRDPIPARDRKRRLTKVGPIDRGRTRYLGNAHPFSRCSVLYRSVLTKGAFSA